MAKLQLPELAFLDPPSPEFPNDLGLFERYRIVEQIGQGGMGMVFRAIDPMLKRTVALKVIIPKYASNTKLRERFLEEARATVAVRSPHVAEVYDCGIWKNAPYLTMELLVGVTLDQKPKPMPTDAWRRIGYVIAKGLADAHRSGMIHRDLKPSNIHLGTDARTGKPTVKLIDFGLARQVDRVSEMTKSGELLGTPAYMSPEQARGQKVDARTDLYSLGVILHQLATGKLPYPSADEGVMAILTDLATSDPLPSVTNLVSDLPPLLASLIDRLLAKDRDRRPASADEVMQILKQSVGTSKVTTSTEVEASVPYLSISEAAVPEVPFEDLATEPSTDSPSPKRKGRRGMMVYLCLGVLLVGVLIVLVSGVFKLQTKDGTTEATGDEVAEPMEDVDDATPAADAKPAVAQSEPVVVARWDFHVFQRPNRVLKLYSNGRADSPDSRSTWRQNGNKLIFRWPDPKAPGGFWVDTSTLSGDGQRFNGKNQMGLPVSGRKLPD